MEMPITLVKNEPCQERRVASRRRTEYLTIRAYPVLFAHFNVPRCKPSMVRPCRTTWKGRLNTCAVVVTNPDAAIPGKVAPTEGLAAAPTGTRLTPATQEIVDREGQLDPCQQTFGRCVHAGARTLCDVQKVCLVRSMQNSLHNWVRNKTCAQTTGNGGTHDLQTCPS